MEYVSWIVTVTVTTVMGKQLAQVVFDHEPNKEEIREQTTIFGTALSADVVKKTSSSLPVKHITFEES